MIPSTIWQTYKKPYEQLPDYIKKISNTWKDKNPDYDYVYMSDDDAREFIRKEYGSKVVKLFDNVPVGVMRADMFRYLVLLKEGGIYADLDTICNVPADEWVDRSNLFVVAPEHEMNFCQWTFAASPDNYILNSVVDLMISRLSNPDYSMKNFVHYHTGPSMFTEGINKAIKRDKDVFCYPESKTFCNNLIDLCTCAHGDLTSTTLESDGFLCYSHNNWHIFRNGAVTHLFGSQTFKHDYDRWIDDEGVKNAGR